MTRPSMIAVDWGTTSLRAWLLDSSGRIVDRRRDRLGIQQIAREAFPGALKTVTAGWRDANPPVLMAGMIGSRQGWIEAPYVNCPAGLAEFVPGLVAVPDVPRAWIVPGLSLREEGAAPDVMRGEETQIFGLDLPDGGLVILPGTHSKWTSLRNGRIEWFATFLTGEVFDVLRRHSILGRMMEDIPAGGIPDGFARGVEEALATARPRLLQSLFSVRTRGLFGEITNAQSAGYLSGLLIGNEIREALAALKDRGLAPRQATLVGVESLVELYAHALDRAGIATGVAGEDCSARGLFRIAQAAQLV